MAHGARFLLGFTGHDSGYVGLNSNKIMCDIVFSVWWRRYYKQCDDRAGDVHVGLEDWLVISGARHPFRVALVQNVR